MTEFDVNDMLFDGIGETIQKALTANPDFTSYDISYALIQHLGTVLINIACPDCRKLHKKNIEKVLLPSSTPAMIVASPRSAG